MDKIFFAIIALAFFFAGMHTVDHHCLEWFADSPEEFDRGDTKFIDVQVSGACEAQPTVLAVGRSRWRVLSAASVVENQGDQWRFELPLPQDTTKVLAYCQAERRSEAEVKVSVATASALQMQIEPVTEPAAAVGQAALNAAKGSVDLAIGLIGYIVLFLGLMKIVEEAGGLAWMARIIRPLMVRLFPDVPADHPAMGAIIMNVAANALGLGNAATPFGLKAMKELNELNPHKGTASNAMCLFLAINTSGLALLPTGIIGLRAKFGSVDPAAIFPTTLMATALSTIAGVLAAKFLARFFISPPADDDFVAPELQRSQSSLSELIPLAFFASALIGLVLVVYVYGEAASAWIMPGLIFGMVAVGVKQGVPVYKTFVDGAKEGFALGTMIIPYLVAILSSIAMFRASGGLDLMVELLSPITNLILLPGEVLPLALLRPLSGSGAFGLTAGIIENNGPDGYIGQLVSTMNGSTETTFYVLAVYFGSVGISRYRHAVWSGLTADIVGVFASILAVNLLL